MRERVEALIEREIEHAQAGRPGRLIFKMNALVDDRLIRALYRASQAGVQCDLIVRGICCLRPGLPGISENIRVISIVGRFLEHSRIYYFENGGDPEVYLGSADLMPRNLDRRVEVIFPINDPAIRNYIRHAILEVELCNNIRARDLHSDGTYTLRQLGRASRRLTARPGCWHTRRRADTARLSVASVASASTASIASAVGAMGATGAASGRNGPVRNPTASITQAKNQMSGVRPKSATGVAVPATARPSDATQTLRRQSCGYGSSAMTTGTRPGRHAPGLHRWREASFSSIGWRMPASGRRRAWRIIRWCC